MFGSPTETAVTCIACGDELRRSDAREYDKDGDRWHREAKQFEYLCKPCDRRRSRQPRRGLESTLVECGAGEVDRDAFLERFCARTANDPAGEPSGSNGDR